MPDLLRYKTTMVSNHLLHVDLFYNQALCYAIKSESQFLFFYIGTVLKLSTQLRITYTYKFQFLLDLCSHVVQSIFHCQNCRPCVINLPLRILSCLRSCSHPIKMASCVGAIALDIIQLFETSVICDSTSLPNPIHNLRLVN